MILSYLCEREKNEIEKNDANISLYVHNLPSPVHSYEEPPPKAFNSICPLWLNYKVGEDIPGLK